jgi:hypothetical protein
MTRTNESRLDRLEALAETTLLAIRELSHRQEATQQQFEQIRDQFDDIRQQNQAINAQQALNAQQIAENTAGLVELRNLIADFIRNQRT